MGDLLVSEGYLDVGYNFVSLDDCWSSKQRTVDGRLQADPARFPSGMKSLGDYVRSFMILNKILQFSLRFWM